MYAPDEIGDYIGQARPPISSNTHQFPAHASYLPTVRDFFSGGFSAEIKKGNDILLTE